jgi:hypothetical protein
MAPINQKMLPKEKIVESYQNKDVGGEKIKKTASHLRK